MNPRTGPASGVVVHGACEDLTGLVVEFAENGVGIFHRLAS
jgi:hypothetical protein